MSKTLPLNITFFWSAIKSTYENEANFTSAANKMLNDLLTTLSTEMWTVDQRRAEATYPSSFRLIHLSTLVNTDAEDTLSDTDKQYLLDNKVLLKHYDPVLGFTGAFLYKPDTEIYSIATIADRFIEPDILYTNTVEYECNLPEGNIKFNINPVKTSPYKTVSIVTPPESNTDLEIETIVYVATQVERKNGALYTDYGCLVYSSDISSSEEIRQYRLKIASLFNLYYHGHTKSALEAAINTMIGLPVTLYEGEVIQHITEEPTLYVVRTDRETYLIDKSIPIDTQTMSEGTRLPIFTPFHTLVDIAEGIDNAPATLPDKIYRILPHAIHHIEDPATLPELFTQSLDLTHRNPFNLKYYYLKTNKGDATTAADLNLVPPASIPSPGDYWLINPAASGYTLTVPQPPELGGGSTTYVKGDIVYYSAESMRYERYRNLEYEGIAAPLTIPVEYGTYHVFVTGGSLHVRDYVTSDLIPMSEVYIENLPPYNSAQSLTFDLFSEYTSHVETNMFDPTTGDYKLQADRDTVSDYNSIVYTKLISAVYLKITITPHIVISSEVMDEIRYMINEVIPHWAVYEIEFA